LPFSQWAEIAGGLFRRKSFAANKPTKNGRHHNRYILKQPIALENKGSRLEEWQGTAETVPWETNWVRLSFPARWSLRMMSPRGSRRGTRH
jgi:hypothetical protein